MEALRLAAGVGSIAEPMLNPLPDVLFLTEVGIDPAAVVTGVVISVGKLSLAQRTRSSLQINHQPKAQGGAGD